MQEDIIACAGGKEIFHSLAAVLSCFTCLQDGFGCAMCGFLFFSACL